MLKWNGKGFLYGIPARDLNGEEVEKHGGLAYLVGTGLYELVEEKKEIKKPALKQDEEREFIDD